jgi:hypothetical protein
MYNICEDINVLLMFHLFSFIPSTDGRVIWKKQKCVCLCICGRSKVDGQKWKIE